MALTLINLFVLDQKELQIPLLLVDGLVIYGAHRYERKLMKEKKDLDAQLAHQADVQQEADKRDKRSRQAANRAQQKAEMKKAQNKTMKQAGFIPPNNIQQPDKAKKI
ncbi:hypothetical protein ACA910_002371 [Epithemia clementina (nom. ined.)]